MSILLKALSSVASHWRFSRPVLATCACFELNTDDYDEDEDLDPTVAITHYLKWRCENDRQ
eukprot:CAMPEP_0118646868 /NCGR_PEP_ID=MMETSP0785-20121206/8297_1 /TAXON_ID=91992 /ORGANISM="Bolidomonas pacifica, Strain CCMP 1866" /LENGTH=60 /DNA_ID=CAMNT_0006538913 /DNA_START=81 /DNA_END=260 /DNA_ORIENTATION=-